MEVRVFAFLLGALGLLGPLGARIPPSCAATHSTLARPDCIVYPSMADPTQTVAPVSPVSPDEAGASDLEAARSLARAHQQLQSEIGKVIVGQQRVVDELLMAVFARGHCLMQGVPGLAKTLLVSTLAATMDLTFRRIQFTPDLMPSDITGTEILQEDPDSLRRRFEFQKGPVFANVLLADE